MVDYMATEESTERMGDAVEKFKLTKEQMNWMKIFKGVHQIERALSQKLQLRFDELQGLKQMYDEAAGRKAELLKLAPLDGLKELPGQEEE